MIESFISMSLKGPYSNQFHDNTENIQEVNKSFYLRDSTKKENPTFIKTKFPFKFFMVFHQPTSAWCIKKIIVPQKSG